MIAMIIYVVYITFAAQKLHNCAQCFSALNAIINKTEKYKISITLAEHIEPTAPHSLTSM